MAGILSRTTISQPHSTPFHPSKNNDHGMAHSFRVNPLASPSPTPPLADAPPAPGPSVPAAPDYGSDLDSDDAAAAAALLDAAESRRAAAASSPTTVARPSDAAATAAAPPATPPPAWVRRGRLRRRGSPPADGPARQSRVPLLLPPG
jgi:hypothetical protein